MGEPPSYGTVVDCGESYTIRPYCPGRRARFVPSPCPALPSPCHDAPCHTGPSPTGSCHAPRQTTGIPLPGPRAPAPAGGVVPLPRRSVPWPAPPSHVRSLSTQFADRGPAGPAPPPGAGPAVPWRAVPSHAMPVLAPPRCEPGHAASRPAWARCGPQSRDVARPGRRKSPWSRSSPHQAGPDPAAPSPAVPPRAPPSRAVPIPASPNPPEPHQVRSSPCLATADRGWPSQPMPPHQSLAVPVNGLCHRSSPGNDPPAARPGRLSGPAAEHGGARELPSPRAPSSLRNLWSALQHR